MGLRRKKQRTSIENDDHNDENDDQDWVPEDDDGNRSNDDSNASFPEQSEFDSTEGFNLVNIRSSNEKQ